ncbi:unnamed protein product, partial [marine sediment metagenome]
SIKGIKANFVLLKKGDFDNYFELKNLSPIFKIF